MDAEFVPLMQMLAVPFKGCCRVSVLLREIDCFANQRVGFTLFASEVGRDGAGVVHLVNKSSLLRMLQSVGFCEKSIAVATRDVKSASVSHAHFFASGGREGDGVNLSPHANGGVPF
ncbi:hypothetical protein CEXT_723811 [Caerostris extrusa]|uniref:Uncharacterized protein n=1 Tax=Caerostris extrusa TaxID=172846 RepID=A0AAV4M5J0_CAEEX|nr:hypothetical protein CEXT_723811 [Caerostris extrusa]